MSRVKLEESRFHVLAISVAKCPLLPPFFPHSSLVRRCWLSLPRTYSIGTSVPRSNILYARESTFLFRSSTAKIFRFVRDRVIYRSSFAKRFLLNAIFSLFKEFDRQTKKAGRKGERTADRVKREGGRKGQIRVSGWRSTTELGMDYNVKNNMYYMDNIGMTLLWHV